MKPDTLTAMKLLITRTRESIPLGTPEAQICSESCRICSKKLLDYLSNQLEEWDYRLEQGDIPSFGDLQKPERSGKRSTVF